MKSIEQWLSDLGLGQYAEQFIGADIDNDVLADLTDEDLRSLGITLGHRKKLLRAISELPPAPEPAPPSPADAQPDLPGKAPAETSAVNSPSADAERRQLSIVFCDLVGSTA